MASSHNLQNFSDKETYPIPRLKENFELITQTYNLLNEHAKLKNTNTFSRRVDFRQLLCNR